MNRNSIFSARRCFQLMLNDIGMGSWQMGVSVRMVEMRTIGLVAIAVLAVSAFLLWTSVYRTGPVISDELISFFHGASYAVLFLLGCFLTSAAFKELHNTEESYAWLTLPGAILEKYVARVILTSLGYILLAAILYGLFVSVLIGTTRLFFSHIIIPFNPFDRIVLEFLAHYLVLHSLFIIGAIVFKSLSGLKTMIAVFTYGLTFGMSWDRYARSHGMEGIDSLRTEPVGIIIAFIFWWVLAPVAWIAGYYLLKRKQV